MAGDYVRGDMNVADQKSTFDGFMAVTVWSSLVTGLTVFYLTLVFAAGQDWLVSLIGCAVLGVIAGMVMKMSTAWYMTVIGLFATGLFSGLIVKLFGMFLAG
jgi:hypothetical protein